MLCWRGGGAVLAFLLLIHGLHVDGQDTSTDRLPNNHQLVIIPKSCPLYSIENCACFQPGSIQWKHFLRKNAH